MGWTVQEEQRGEGEDRRLDERDPGALVEAAGREEEEARTLEMLADADEQASPTASIAASDRAVGAELVMEAEFLRRKAAERSIARRGAATAARRR
jgi:hypothetical protein